jgi:hypothetical protein
VEIELSTTVYSLKGSFIAPDNFDYKTVFREEIIKTINKVMYIGWIRNLSESQVSGYKHLKF